MVATMIATMANKRRTREARVDVVTGGHRHTYMVSGADWRPGAGRSMGGQVPIEKSLLCLSLEDVAGMLTTVFSVRV